MSERALLFEFEHVVVALDGASIVLDIDALQFPDEGITVLIGPSGAGKSTLLRLCNRLEVPTSGRVRYRGDDISLLDPLVLRRRVGMVFQRPTLFGGTVADNLRVARAGADRGVCGGALQRAGLDPAFLDRTADEISGGEAQRVCLARTLLTDPEVLLMDEPTSALDPSMTRTLERLAVRLAGDGVSIVWVTHDLAQAERIADRKVVLSGGRLADESQAARYISDSTSPPTGGEA